MKGLIVFFILLGIGLWWMLQPGPEVDDSKTPKTPVSQEGSTRIEAEKPDIFYYDPETLSKKNTTSSRLADQLNQPERTPQEDLSLIKTIFRHYRTAYKANPIGTHEQILSHLTGKNPNAGAFIPLDHPAIYKGKLHDRWGTPFYFHQISKDIMEVRSAGPDGRHWNSDDFTIR